MVKASPLEQPSQVRQCGGKGVAPWRWSIGFVRSGLTVAFLLSVLTTDTLGQQVTGYVVCAGCSLEEARAAQPSLSGLYQLTHDEGQVVLNVLSFYDPAEAARWQNIAGLTHQLQVRAEDQVFQ